MNEQSAANHAAASKEPASNRKYSEGPSSQHGEQIRDPLVDASPSPSSSSSSSSESDSGSVDSSSDEDEEESEDADQDNMEGHVTRDPHALRGRLASFISQLAAANRELVEEDQAGANGTRKRKRVDAFEIVAVDEADPAGDAATGVVGEGGKLGEDEHVSEDGEEDGEVYIEMDLGLGVLEERKDDEGEIKLRDSTASNAASLTEDEETRCEAEGGRAKNTSGGATAMERLMDVGQRMPKKRNKLATSTGGRILEVPDE